MNKVGLPLLPREVFTQKDVRSMSTDMGSYLKYIFRKTWPTENYFRFGALVEKNIDVNGVDKHGVARYWVGSVEAEEAEEVEEVEEVGEADELKVAFFFASLYHRSALKALRLDEPDENERALTLLFYATRQIGIMEGYQRFVERIEASFKGPLKGGQANQYVREEVGAHLIALLDKVSNESWRSQEKIASNLKDELEIFIMAKSYGKIIPNAENFIRAALRKKGRPREAYLFKKMARKK